MTDEPHISFRPGGPDAFAIEIEGRIVANVSRQSLTLHGATHDDDEARAERAQSVEDWETFRSFVADALRDRCERLR